MARKPVSPSNVAVAVIVAFALFLVAIIVRNFWLILILGFAGSVTLACSVAGAHARFTVSDTGPGIPAARRTQVLDRSWRDHSSAAAGPRPRPPNSPGTQQAQGGEPGGAGAQGLRVAAARAGRSRRAREGLPAD